MPRQKKKNGASRQHRHSLQIYISEELRDRIRRAANAEELSESAYCRRILINMVPGNPDA
jgi:hypothetical protein